MAKQLKIGAKLIPQEGRPIPIQLQSAVETKQGHIEKAKPIDKNCFVSPAVITMKEINPSKSLWTHRN